MLSLVWKKLWHHRTPSGLTILGLAATNSLLADSLTSASFALGLDARNGLLLGVGMLLWSLFFFALGKGFFRDFVALQKLGLTQSQLNQLKYLFLTAILLPSIGLSFLLLSLLHSQAVGTLLASLAGLGVLYGLLGLFLFKCLTPPHHL